MIRAAFACLPAALALALSACGPCDHEEEGVVRTMVVEPYLLPCSSFYQFACLQARSLSDTGHVDTFGGIEGFAFEWGYRVVLEVEQTPIPDPPEDGPATRTVLLRTVSRTVDTGWEFDAVLVPGSDFGLSGDTLRIEGYPKPIRFQDPADRDRLASPTTRGFLTFTVRHGNSEVLHGDYVSTHPVP